MTIDSKKLDNVDKVFEQKRLECRADHIPCTVQSTYSNLDGKGDVLLRRELKVLDSKQVIIGIEYDDKGIPLEIYTQDDKGKRLKLTTQSNTQNKVVKDLIGERLNAVSAALAQKEEANKDTPHFEKEPDKTGKTNTLHHSSKDVSEEILAQRFFSRNQKGD